MDALRKLKHLHFVSTLLEPHSRAEEALLRADIPVSTQEVPIHPEVTLTEGLHVEISISNFSELKSSHQQRWTHALGRNLKPAKNISVIEQNP